MGGIFEELKRRNVIRVAIAYVVVGWLLVQITALAVPAFAMPPWVNTVVFYFVLLGFPLALLLAWAYELTPEGLKRSRQVDPEVSIAPSTGRKLDFVIIGALVLGLGYFVWESRFTGTPETGEERVAGTSIAVLPFVNLSSDPEQEYFTDGISEELLNVLAQVPDLRVTSRTSAFQFKGENRDIKEIARQLSVAHVLEGSVRKSGNTIRITAQLIDAVTDTHLWSATYDRELDDIFAVQDEISAAIVAALSETLGLTLPSAPKVQQTANSAAYDAYLLGVLEASRRNGASMEAAKQHLERALELDPGYAPAHARLSIVLGLLPSYNDRYTFAGVEETWAFHTARAMALAPDAPESLAAKGYYAWSHAVPLEAVRATFERVVALNPSYTDVLNWLASISRLLGDYQANIDISARALRIDPLNLLNITNSAVLMSETGRFDEARVLIERLRTLSPRRYLTRSGTLAGTRGLKADAAIYYLESLDVDRTNNVARKNLVNILAFGMGLVDESSSFDHGHLGVLVLNGQMEEALSIAEGDAARGSPGILGQVLLLAGRPGEAVGYLDQAWDQALVNATVDKLGLAQLIDIGRARQMTGDQVGGQEALEAALAVIARQRAAGWSLPALDWTEGVARYFLDQKESGISLVRRAEERGFMRFVYRRFLMAPQYQPQYQALTDDPAYAPILIIREAYAAAERDKFLTIVCNGGSPAPEVWTPKPETCAGYVEG